MPGSEMHDIERERVIDAGILMAMTFAIDAVRDP